MPEVPGDLIPLAELLEDKEKPRRTWWDAQIAGGKITPYKIPGKRGLFLSQAAVNEILKPHPVVKGEADEDAG